jgi:hypothetical protein
MSNLSRRQLFQKSLTASATSGLSGSISIKSVSGKPAPRSLAEVGWVWEGQGLDPGVYPSIFGVGEGSKYFGLSRAVFIFHPTTELALEKLRNLKEIVCDISKWKFRRNNDGGTANWVDGSPPIVREEAAHLSRLSLSYPNVTGGFHDDMRGLLARHNYGPDQYKQIYDALRSHNKKLKLWAVVYTHELDEDWGPYLPYIDVVNLWVWESKNLPQLDRHIARCQEMFPGKPINMGCYLRDYTLRAAVPMDHLEFQWEKVLEGVSKGTLSGYSILAAVLIDVHAKEARWVRDFIAAN